MRAFVGARCALLALICACSRDLVPSRYRKRHADDDQDGDAKQHGDALSGGKGRDGRSDGLTAVAAVTAAAEAVEEELRGQLQAKEEALRQGRAGI